MYYLKCFWHYLIGLVAFIFLPFLWLGINIVTPIISPKELFNEWWIQMKSKKAWGVFDGEL